MVRKPVVAGRSLEKNLAIIASTVLIASCDVDLWDVGHAVGDRLHANRPECPVMWDTIPLFPTAQVESLLKKDPTQRRKELPNGFHVMGSKVVFTPLSVVNPLTGSATQDGDIPLSGPITNIPEFHDCQRFLSDDGSQFDSLFAIFASFTLDATMQTLQWRNVAVWAAGPAAVVSVNSATGLVHAEAPGSATITAVDELGNALGPFSVTVTGPPSPGGGLIAPSMPLGNGAPPALMAPGQERQAVLQMGAPTRTPIVAAATIYSYGPGYAPLGIGPNFNCLYLYFSETGALRAKMVPVNTLPEYQHACLTAVDPNLAQGKELAVARSVATLRKGDNAIEMYPSVARWDADPETGKHHIGIRCLKAWCEIGEPTGAVFAPPPAYSVSNSALLGERKVVQVKGWYDEQILAAPGTDGSLRPSGLRGTVIPAPTLDGLTKAILAKSTSGGPDPWSLVAYVAIRDLANDQAAVAHYRDKLGLEPAPVGPLNTLNQMHYCYGTKDQCLVPSGAGCDNWFANLFFKTTRVWVKIVSVSGTVKYLCVTRRGHPAFSGNVPATARWRWILGDDTIWTACVQGCCQTETGGA